MRPGLDGLEPGRRAQNEGIGVPAAYDLEPDGQAFSRKPAWHTYGRLSG